MNDGYFTSRERALLGGRFDALYTAPAQICRGVTVNRLRCTPQQFAAVAGLGTLRPSPLSPDSFLLEDEGAKPGRHAYHHAGVFYVQEPSAAMPAGFLNVHPGDRVLDLCAAPGGKSSQLAAALGGRGLLVANEYVPARAAVLKNNLERMGVANAVVLCEDTARIAVALAGWFDKVLVDAPCSGEGMFRKEPQALRQHSPALVAHCAALGREILDNAAACVAPGGLLCYSTCTFAPEEDEGQVGAFLQRHPDFMLLDAPTAAGCPGEPARSPDAPFAAEKTRRIYPCHGGEGHFAALLRRSADISAASLRPARGRAVPALCAEFLREYFPGVPARAAYVAGESVFLLPDAMPDLGRLHVLRAGVEAGRIVKNRFEPAHGLFMAWGALCANVERLSLNDVRTDAWLRGEEIVAHTARPGWTAVLVDGFPLGVGKCSGGRIKNHYPKGLRNLG